MYNQSKHQVNPDAASSKDSQSLASKEKAWKHPNEDTGRKKKIAMIGGISFIVLIIIVIIVFATKGKSPTPPTPPGPKVDHIDAKTLMAIMAQMPGFDKY